MTITNLPSEFPLLRMKLTPPASHAALLARPRLHAELEAGLQDRLTLATAPAGYGKTVLLSMWSQQSASAVAWLTLDEGDNDPRRFWRYSAAALQSVRPEIAGAAHPLFLPGADLEADVRRLLNALQTHVTAATSLVLDNIHLIHQPEIYAALNFCLTYLPPQLHLYLAGRSAPPLALARLRGKSQLRELRTADLAFTVEETQQLSVTLTGSAAEAVAWRARTDGWAVGLRLGLTSRAAPAAFTGDLPTLREFFADEVLAHQDPAARAFLLQTATPEPFTVASSAAAAHSATEEAAAILERLEREGHFVAALDDERRTYRYHPLFAEALRAMRAELPPANGVAQPADPLSARETQILRLLIAGLSNKEVAQQLSISLNTAKNHLKSLYSKLGVHTRAQAVARAAELGLLPRE